ncbi:hypothetical protein, partial [Bacillus cereus]|uniref:hypothetical protein n=1 Tax=Bacillus cereus TaxID=1396 RepID=UPI00345BF910
LTFGVIGLSTYLIPLSIKDSSGKKLNDLFFSSSESLDSSQKLDNFSKEEKERLGVLTPLSILLGGVSEETDKNK